LWLLLSAVSGDARKAGAMQIAHRLDELAAMAGQCINSARRISHGLLPLQFSDGSFSRALSNLVETTNAAATGIDVTLEVGEEPLGPISPVVAEAGYRIVQEALTNAVRHGRPTQIIVKSWREHNRLKLTVTDNGAGLAGICKDGMGLKIMQFRARELGGDVAVVDTPAGGVSVSCVIPLSQPPL